MEHSSNSEALLKFTAKQISKQFYRFAHELSETFRTEFTKAWDSVRSHSLFLHCLAHI